VVQAARRLAQLDCADVGPLQPTGEELQAMMQRLQAQWDEEAPVLREELDQALAQLESQREAAAAAGQQR
jgi:hypothetical protein